MGTKHIFLTQENRGHKLIKPTYDDNDDNAIFQHCAEGMIAVTQEYFETKMKRVLFMHGYVGLISPEKEKPND